MMICTTLTIISLLALLSPIYAQDCGQPVAPTNGVVEAPDTTVGSEAKYSCDAGYTLDGVTARTCTVGDTWDGTVPTCSIKDCGPLSNPTDGTVDVGGGTTYLQSATYTCNAGYVLTGGTTRTCQQDGTWSSTPPTCVIRDCGPLSNPTDGTVDVAGGTTYLQSATYTCNAGYVLTGGTTRTCQQDGTWSSTPPTCVIRDCGPLSNPTDGTVDVAGGTTYLQSATYTCNAGYVLTGGTTRTCQQDGTWSSTPPTCVIRDCGPLSNPTDGTVDVAGGTTYLQSATYTCNAGYVLTGGTTRTCQQDGTWSSTPPTCVIRDCGPLSNPTDGTVDVAGGTTYLQSATYTCNAGYVLTGGTTRTCQQDGTWSSTPPTCVIRDCGPLSNPTDGTVDVAGGTTYLQSATYTCNAGYVLTGGTTRTCQQDGTWSSTPPTCVIKDCGQPVAPTNGVVEAPVTTVGSEAQYSCDAGYTLDGVTARTCTAGDTWDGTVPTCSIKDCGPLSNPTDGTVDVAGGTTYLQSATYTCNAGYVLTGGTTRTCQQDGTWSSTPPTCVIRDCGGLTNPVNGLVTTNDGTNFGDSATYTCLVGYFLTGSSSRSCGSDGTWGGSAPVCALKDCGSPTPITNGAYSFTQTTYTSDVTYSCDTNYGLVGSPTVTCLSTGDWDTNTPTCVLDCGTPSSITDGIVSYPDGTVVGATATYTCTTGYIINGGATITCGADGSWSTGPTCEINLDGYGSPCVTTATCATDGASCLAQVCVCSSDAVYDANLDKCLADCGGLTDPTNGVVSVPTQTTEGQTATYTCNAGYALSGSSSRTCGSSGSWDGSAPTCIFGCTEPDPPDNGHVNTTGGLAAGAVVTYTCNTGYSLVGPFSRICLSDTTWSGQTPTCNKECPMLTGIANGDVDLSRGNWADSIATYICDRNYALVGQSTRKCQSTGLWSGLEPTCHFAMLPDVLVAFGVLFIVLILVDVVVLVMFLYNRYYQKQEGTDNKEDGEEDMEEDDTENEIDEKKPSFLSFMIERPEGGAMPPFAHSRNKRSKYSRISPGVTGDPEVRMRSTTHPPPQKPRFGQVKVEKMDKGDRPSILDPPREIFEKPMIKRERTFEATTFGPGKARFKPQMELKPTVTEPLVPPAPTDDKPGNTADGLPEKDGYQTRNSNNSNDKREPSPAEADQLSLDEEFDLPEPPSSTVMGRTDGLNGGHSER